MAWVEETRGREIMSRPFLKVVEELRDKSERGQDKVPLLESAEVMRLVIEEIAGWCDPEDGFPVEHRRVFDALQDLSRGMVHDDVFDGVESNFGGVFAGVKFPDE